MNSKQRITAALTGQQPDYVPLTTWCFGLQPPPELTWKRDGKTVAYWYTNRLEHLHCLPQGWTLRDEFNRALAWQSLGVDDVLEVSVPWSMSPKASYQDAVIEPGAPGGDARYPVMVRTYQTPDGVLRHAVCKTEPEGPGWPVQPDCVPLIEDYNIPRAVEHAVATPDDVPRIAHLFAPPDEQQAAWFARRMDEMKPFAEEHGLFTQAWTGFGMDAVVWFTGTENAIMMAMEEPDAFERLVGIIADTDAARTELAARSDGVDMVCQRGWYSSTDFWSPQLFDRFVFPHVKRLAEIAHKHGKFFGYVMTTGVETLGPRLAEAGVDLLFFVDPVMDGLAVERARELFGGRMTMVGGTNALSLAGDEDRIRTEVRRAVETLGPTNRFILHPVDAVFPDTPWRGVQTLIDAWKRCR